MCPFVWVVASLVVEQYAENSDLHSGAYMPVSQLAVIPTRTTEFLLSLQLIPFIWATESDRGPRVVKIISTRTLLWYLGNALFENPGCRRACDCLNWFTRGHFTPSPWETKQYLSYPMKKPPRYWGCQADGIAGETRLIMFFPA